jgi:hypothetical protein
MVKKGPKVSEKNVTEKSTKKRRSYDESTMRKAIEMVKNNKNDKASLRKIADFFEVPKSTLSNRVNNDLIDKKPGRGPILEETEEDLSKIIIKLSQWGHGLDYVELRQIINEFIMKNKKVII